MGRLRGSPERCRRQRVSKLPLGLLVLFCVLAMHGFQASPNPTEMSGVPLMAMSAGHAVPATVTVMGAHHRLPGGEEPGDHHNDHPGGQVCLAMLTMLVLVWTAIALCRRASVAVAVQILTRVRILLVGRPPPRPSLHQLSVLRL